jgi:hypothetical protein
MTVEQALISAINHQVSVQVDHQGHSKWISPVRLGWKTTKKDGLHKNLFCYQFGGYSSRGLKPDGSMDNYRCWNLDDVTSVLPINAAWHGGYGFPKEPSDCIDDVIAGPRV